MPGVGCRVLTRAILILLALRQLPAQDTYQQAISYVQQGKLDEAIPLLERILDKTPADLRARNLMGIALSSAGKREEANRHFQLALEIDPKFYPALKNLALNELALGRIAEAKGHFEDALKLASRDPAAHFGLAEIESRSGAFESAVAHYEQSGDLYLKDPQALLNYARGCLETKQPAKAVRALGNLPAGSAAAIHFEAGLLLAKLDDYPAAAQQFRLARQGSTDPYQPGFNLVLALVKSRDPAAAIREGEQLIAQGRRTAELLNLLAQAYEASGKTKEAYDALRSATELDPADESSYLDLIALCLEHHNYDLSLEIADIGVRLIPGSRRMRLERGVVLVMKGRMEEAEKEFEASSGSGPDGALGQIAWGLVLMQMNRMPEAIDVLRRLRDKNESDHLANWYLAEALSRDGAEPGSDREAEAIRALEQSVRSNPGVPQSRVLLGKMLLRRGQVDRAIEHFEKALDLDKDNVAAAYQLAQVYRKNGKPQRAAELFAIVSKAKEEDPGQFTQRGLLHIVREGSR
jgi:tetratricopeptide (TPR) repeat protein